MRNFPLNRKALYLTFAVMLFMFSLPRTVFSQASNEFIPFDQLVFVPCANGGTGEDVQISGTIHTQTHAISTGNRFVSKSHAQTQGTTGLGLITGNIYHEVRMFDIRDNSAVVEGTSS